MLLPAQGVQVLALSSLAAAQAQASAAEGRHAELASGLGALAAKMQTLELELQAFAGAADGSGSITFADAGAVVTFDGQQIKDSRAVFNPAPSLSACSSLSFAQGACSAGVSRNVHL
jgi:hypothetical protein